VVGWEVCCGVGWEEEGVTGRRVQECRRLSAEPVVKRQRGQKPNRTRLSQKWRNPKTNQNEKYSEMERIRDNKQIRNNKQKCTKSEIPTDPAKRKESQENKIREQNCPQVNGPIQWARGTSPPRDPILESLSSDSVRAASFQSQRVDG